MAEQGFTLTSPEFSPDGLMPVEATGDGNDVSPELRWSHSPESTRSFALIMDDPDAPNPAEAPAAVAQLVPRKARFRRAVQPVSIP